jgi:hypothetical protein
MTTDHSTLTANGKIFSRLIIRKMGLRPRPLGRLHGRITK